MKRSFWPLVLIAIITPMLWAQPPVAQGGLCPAWQESFTSATLDAVRWPVASGSGNAMGNAICGYAYTTEPSFRFVSWADSRDYTCVLYGLAQMASAKNPAFTIFPGDLTDNYDVSTDTQSLDRCAGYAPQLITWKDAINGGDPGSGLFDRTFATKGNHDDVAGDWLAYFNFAAVASRIGATHYSEFLSASTCGANPCRAYSFDYLNSHFIGSDVQSSGDVADIPADVVTWMDQDLTSAEKRPGMTHAFLFWHGPFYYVDEHPSAPSSSLIGVVNKHPIIAATFHGHEHVEAHVHVDGAHTAGLSLAFEEFVTGGGGAGLVSCTGWRIQAGDWCVGLPTDAAPYGPGFKGYSTIDVQGNGITVTFYDASNVQRASFSFAHSPPTGTGPTVTSNQAVAQGDPTTKMPVSFTVVFSESVTGFTNAGVTLGGTAPGNKTIEISGSGATYGVTVSGISGPGTLTATILAGVATGVVSGLTNQASTSTDNTVTYEKKRAGQTVTN